VRQIRLTPQSLKVQWLLYAPLDLKIPRSAHTVYVCGLRGSQNSHYFPTQRKAKVLFHPLLPDVREGTAIWEVSRTRPFVLLTATDR